MNSSLWGKRTRDRTGWISHSQRLWCLTVVPTPRRRQSLIYIEHSREARITKWDHDSKKARTIAKHWNKIKKPQNKRSNIIAISLTYPEKVGRLLSLWWQSLPILEHTIPPYCFRIAKTHRKSPIWFTSSLEWPWLWDPVDFLFLLHQTCLHSHLVTASGTAANLQLLRKLVHSPLILDLPWRLAPSTTTETTSAVLSVRLSPRALQQQRTPATLLVILPSCPPPTTDHLNRTLC